MKKIYFIAAAAAMLTACTNTDELASVETQVADKAAVNFDVYTQRGITRAGEPGTITTTSLQQSKYGFGVFGFYTSNSEYDTNSSTPNFMYNQQVLYKNNAWVYEPVKYWPNEFGNTAESDDLDHVTFFAYAPWVDVTVTNGTPILGANEDADSVQRTNITQLTKNSATGDPIVKYVVDTNPTSSVDLLWGVAADGTSYKGMDGKTVNAGSCFIDLTKQNDVSGKVKWNFKHALSRLNVKITTAVDVATAAQYDPASSYAVGTEGDLQTTDDSTKVYLRAIKFGGFVLKGALNLHSEDAASVDAAKPNWFDYDGSTELTSEYITFYDGLKDGKEGTTNNIQKNEKPTGLNKVLLEEPTTANWGSKKAGVPAKVWANLFDGAKTADDSIFVIPTGEPVEIEVIYDVQTADKKLTGILSDAITHGSAVENRISKKLKLASGADLIFEAGKAYGIKIILGLESVKFDVEVTPWDMKTPTSEVELPANLATQP